MTGSAPETSLHTAVPSISGTLDEWALTSITGREVATAEQIAQQTDQSILAKHLPLPNLAVEHLRHHPFAAPERVDQKLLWYEGSFDPIGVHHFEIFNEAVNLGFKRAVFAIVFQNPYKADSLPYEHRYEMARRTMEKAGLTVVDSPEEDGICIFRPGEKIKFDAWRLHVLYSINANILIGPDNFAKAVLTNALWTHQKDVAANPIAQERYGFRDMINQIPGFREKILVYPLLHDIHSTDIRNGSAPMLETVKQYTLEHTLYQKKPDQNTPSVAPSLVARPVSQVRTRQLEGEYSHRCELEKRIEQGLVASGLCHPLILDAVGCELGQLDLSEMNELTNALNQTRDISRNLRKGITAGVIEETTANHVTRPLRTAISSSLFGSQMVTEGEHHVHRSYMEEQKKIIFVGNHSGWGDILSLTHALKLNRLGALADKTSFVLHSDVFTSPLVEELFGSSINSIKIRRNVGFSMSDPAVGNLEKKAFERALNLLHQGAIAVFPQQPNLLGESEKITNPFGQSLLWALEQFQGNRQDDVALDDTVIIPWSHIGGSTIQKGESVFFTDESPAVVRFGQPVPLSTVMNIIEGEGKEITAHTLGALVAQLLPVDMAGIYGDFRDYHLSIESLSRSPIERTAIMRGQELAKQLTSLLEMQTKGIVN